jgi:D-alanine-D-alanine ligase
MRAETGAIAILYDRPQPGASADERERPEVVAAIRHALGTLGHPSVTVVLGSDPRICLARLRALRPRAVINLVEGWRGDPACESLGALLCRSVGVPHSGSPAHALALAGDKVETKVRLRRSGLPTPGWITDLRHWREDEAPYLVKAVTAHGSFGLGPRTLVRTPGEARARLRALRERHAGVWFLERYVEGREFHVALLSDHRSPRPRVLPPSETVFDDWTAGKPRIVDFRAKWDPRSRAYHRTRRRFLDRPDEAPLRSTLARLGRRVWTAFGLEGYARLDLRQGRDGRLEIIDVNPNPSLHPEAGFAAAAAADGIDYVHLVAALLPKTEARP